MILVIDGDQALKKRGTALEREHIRTKALDRTTANLDTLETRIATADTDADVAITIEVQSVDIVISSDSDMLAYDTINTLLRPVSSGLVLVYFISSLLRSLGITRSQLTALAIVLKKDYTKTFFRSDRPLNPKVIMTAYLSDDQVVSKNKDTEQFTNVLSVFVDRQQTKVVDD
ncbi:hypothetical protein BGZ97_013051, partial [Linnemannia gamsii]